MRSDIPRWRTRFDACLVVQLVELRVVVLFVFNEFTGGRGDDAVRGEEGHQEHVVVEAQLPVPVEPCRAVRHWPDRAAQPGAVGAHQQRAGEGFAAAFEALVLQEAEGHPVQDGVVMLRRQVRQKIVDGAAAGNPPAFPPGHEADVFSRAAVAEYPVHGTVRLNAGEAARQLRGHQHPLREHAAPLDPEVGGFPDSFPEVGEVVPDCVAVGG